MDEGFHREQNRNEMECTGLRGTGSSIETL